MDVFQSDGSQASIDAQTPSVTRARILAVGIYNSEEFADRAEAFSGKSLKRLSSESSASRWVSIALANGKFYSYDRAGNKSHGCSPDWHYSLGTSFEGREISRSRSEALR
jgi:hypothetical protein